MCEIQRIQSARYKGYKVQDTKLEYKMRYKLDVFLLRIKLVKQVGRGKHSIHFIK